jgi:hypothetical protein
LPGVARNHRLKQRAAGRRRETIADRIASLSDERDLAAWDTGVGVRIPLGYKAPVEVVFGQAARRVSTTTPGPGTRRARAWG